MIINIDKSIYSRDAIYRSLDVWNKYLSTPEISENNAVINVLIDNIKVEENTIKEFLNYILDLTTSAELS